jgi:hypothetical protein
MASKYRVQRMFAHCGRFYTRDNEAEVSRLPQEVIDAQVESGAISLREPEKPKPAAATGKDK